MKYRFLRFPGGKAKAMTFSYDDGCRLDINLAGIFNNYGMKATFNINSGFISETSGDWHLTADEIKKYILSAGHEIAVHGEKHIAPGYVGSADGINDVLECRKSLERLSGKIIRGMAYPDCGITRIIGGCSKEDIKSYLKMLGIAYSRTLGGDNNRFEMPDDWLEWMPTAHHNNPKLSEYLDEFFVLGDENFKSSYPKLFYLWGHSFEFESNDNWNIIEDFCKKASNNPEVWYATNIEIYDYASAYRSLIFNIDNTMVYNPSLYEVWFCADGKTYSVKSGETLKL